MTTGTARVETPRLILRAYEASDLDALFRIQNDREAMPLAFFESDLEKCRHFHETHAAQRAINGFAPWVVVLKASAQIIGWGGLHIDPFDPGWGIEVGYFLDRAHRRQGLASELVQATLAHGFKDLGMEEIGAYATGERRIDRRADEGGLPLRTLRAETGTESICD